MSRSSAKLIMDAVKPWPPSGWAGSHNPYDHISPNILTAVLKRIAKMKDGFSLTFTDGGQSFNTAVHVADGRILGQVEEALLGAEGKTIAEIGALHIADGTF